jgi:threonyl-tRNA synthetase
VLGSLERFIGVYLEHTAGHLPVWLSPTQVVLLNVTDRVNPFCEKLETHLRENFIRVEFDRRNEKLNFKIREAQLKKVPYMLIIGDKEAEAGTVSIRLSNGSLYNNLKWEEACNFIIKNRDGRYLSADHDLKTSANSGNLPQEAGH